MSPLLIVTALAATVVSVLMAAYLGRTAEQWGLVDVPNERSSHERAMPRGGGLGMVVAWALSIAVLASQAGLDVFWSIVLLSVLAIAGIGLADDVSSRSPRYRLLVHFAGAGAAVYAAAPLPQPFAPGFTLPFVILFVLWTLAIVWSVNLFNFMDGIDGIAAIEALFCAIIFAALARSTGDFATCWAAVMLAAALCGFLLLNWPPARIFMGDVGSGFLGAALGCIAIALASRGNVPVATLALVPALFITDATVTLVRRIFRRERVFEAHRSHAYQILARQWGSHRTVVLAAVLVNLLFVLPLIVISLRYPGYAWELAVLCYAALTMAAVEIGAGTIERCA